MGENGLIELTNPKLECNAVANSSGSVTLSAIANRPQVTVSCGGEDLTEGEDYTISYTDSKDGTNATTTWSGSVATNIGTHYIIITGVGAVKGSMMAKYEIVKKKITIPEITMPLLSYTGASLSPTITSPDSGFITATGISATTVGNYEATFTLKSTAYTQWENETTDAKTKVWVITKKYLPIPTLKSEYLSFAYTGGEIKLLPSYFNNFDESLMRIVQGGSGTNSGSYSVRIELIDPSNYAWNNGIE